MMLQESKCVFLIACIFIIGLPRQSNGDCTFGIAFDPTTGAETWCNFRHRPGPSLDAIPKDAGIDEILVEFHQDPVGINQLQFEGIQNLNVATWSVVNLVDPFDLPNVHVQLPLTVVADQLTWITLNAVTLNVDNHTVQFSATFDNPQIETSAAPFETEFRATVQFQDGTFSGLFPSLSTLVEAPWSSEETSATFEIFLPGNAIPVVSAPLLELVPEPSSAGLFGIGYCVTLIPWRRRASSSVRSAR